MALGSANKYDSATIAFHWTVALLVVCLWIGGQTTGLLPKGPFRQGVWSTHVLCGFLLTLVLILRLSWRLTRGAHLPEVGSPLVRAAASLVHKLLYALLFAVIGLGIASAFNRGMHFYGLAQLPQIGDKALKKPITHWHELAANTLLIVAVIHAAAALAHHYLWKDAVLGRMLPRVAAR